MPITVDGKNTALDAQAITHVAAFQGDPTAGGTQLGARAAITIAPAAGGDAAASTQPAIAIGAGQQVQYLGFYTAATGGSLRAYSANGGTPFRYALNLATNTFTATAHGLANGDRVVFMGGTPPTGLALGTLYYVVGATADTFQVSTTAGGAAVDVTGAGDAWVEASKIVPEAFGNAGTFTVNSASLTLNA